MVRRLVTTAFAALTLAISAGTTPHPEDPPSSDLDLDTEWRRLAGCMADVADVNAAWLEERLRVTNYARTPRERAVTDATMAAMTQFRMVQRELFRLEIVEPGDVLPCPA